MSQESPLPPDNGKDSQHPTAPAPQLGTQAPDQGNDSPHFSAPTLHVGTHAPVADWSSTPEIVLANIFSLLPVLDRQSATRVCCSWSAACCHPTVWRHFDYGMFHPDSTIRQINALFDELRSKHKQYVDLIDAYGSLFSSVHVILYYPESFEVLKNLAQSCRGVKFCVLSVYGTSQLTEYYRRIVSLFLTANTSMRDVCFRNVDFSAGNERNAPFPLGHAYTRNLRKLSLVNSFRQNNLSALMYLINVTELTLLPHQVRFTWLYHLAKCSLHTLNIVNMIGVWKFDFDILPEESWQRIAQCPQLRVHCYLVDIYNCSKLLCPSIPLATLVCREYFNLRLKPLDRVITTYADTLTTFVYYSQNENSYSCNSLPLRADEDVLAIVQNCPKLRTLAVKDGLYSSTLLLMVQLNPSFREPIVREDMVHYEFHVPQDVTLSRQVRDYTEDNFSADRFVPAMSRLLQRDWHPLPRKEYFSLLKVRYSSW